MKHRCRLRGRRGPAPGCRGGRAGRAGRTGQAVTACDHGFAGIRWRRTAAGMPGGQVRFGTGQLSWHLGGGGAAYPDGLLLSCGAASAWRGPAWFWPGRRAHNQTRPATGKNASGLRICRTPGRVRLDQCDQHVTAEPEREPTLRRPMVMVLDRACVLLAAGSGRPWRPAAAWQASTPSPVPPPRTHRPVPRPRRPMAAAARRRPGTRGRWT